VALLESNKRGNVVDLMTHPTFVILVALGLVGIAIIQATTEVGSDTTYEQKYYSADAALLMDSLYAVRKDVNLQYTYLLPSNLGLKIENFKATAYTDLKPKGNSFYFTMDTNYEPIIPITIPIGKTPIFYKNGKKIGITDKKINYEQNIICEENLPAIQTSLIEKSKFKTEQKTNMTGPSPLIIAEITKGPSQLIIYTNNKGYANNLACHFSKKLRENGVFDGYSIVPITEILTFDDTTKQITSTEEPAIYIRLRQPELLPGINLAVHGAIQQTINPGPSI